MRVLGIDPGLTRCGVGVVDGSVGKQLSLVDVGVVRTAADMPIEQRLCLIAAGLEEWCDATRPDAVAVERVFSQHNVRTVMALRCWWRRAADCPSRCTLRARSRRP
jgi:crossover junction endodeoxyribonuclease RuvC